MATMFVAVALAFAAGMHETEAEPDRVGLIKIYGNQWTADSPILDALDLYPGMALTDEATILRTELRLSMLFHDRFDLDAEQRPTIKVLPRVAKSSFRDIEVHFPETKPKKKSARLKNLAYSGPKGTYQTFIKAVRKGDLEEAKKCWVIDDDNKSGALDVIVGIWTSFQRLNQVAGQRFGPAGIHSLPANYQRDDVTDRTFQITEERLADAKASILEDAAVLRFRWMWSDSPAFDLGSTVKFRKVAGEWEIDAGRELFAPRSWGLVFCDQIVIMEEAADGMNSGRLKTSNQLKAFLDRKLTARVKKYNKEP